MKENLLALGFTERETNAYLALLNFPEATANQIAKITKEHRTNIYDSLNSLLKKSLITYNIKNNVHYYRASDPEKLIDFLKEKEKIAENLIPKLKAKLTHQEPRPLVEIFEGKEGFKSILQKALKENKTIYSIGASGEWEKQFPLPLQQYMRERERKKIHAKLLYVKGTNPINHNLNEIRFLPIEFNQPSTIVIFGDYVAILMWTEPLVATLTKSSSLSFSFKKYFETLWKISKK